KFITCDDKDVEIQDVTNRIIWAYSNSAPDGSGSGGGGAGGHVDRGSLSLRLRSGGTPQRPSDSPLLTLDMAVDDVTVTPDDVPSGSFQVSGVMIQNGGEGEGKTSTTSYWCKGINVTHLGGSPQHAVG
ncbi:hypothetical protein TrRE_jg11057, partial [Triparma retinervis]